MDSDSCVLFIFQDPFLKRPLSCHAIQSHVGEDPYVIVMVFPSRSLNPWPDMEMPAALLNSMYSAPFRATLTRVTEPMFKYIVAL